MPRLRKYLVFWIIILGAFAPFAASVGIWARTVLKPKPTATIAATESSDSNSINVQSNGREEQLALDLEADFDMLDVVNIAHVGNGTGDLVFVIQMGIEHPVEDATYEAILVKALQGLDSLKQGDENFYWVELMYGNWLVGRLECNAQQYAAQDISSDNCEYNDVNPAAYIGDMVRWPGRPGDNIVLAE